MEAEALALGSERFKRRLLQAEQSGQASMVGAGRKLLAHAIEPVAKAIQFKLDESDGRGPGKRHAALKWMRALGPDVAAYMTVKTVLDSVTRRPGMRKVHTLRSTAQTISELILDELKYRRFMEKAPGLFHYKLSSFRTSSYAHMSRSLNASMTFAEIDTSDLFMTPTQRVAVGAWLIDLMVQATGLVEVVTEDAVKKGRKMTSPVRIVATEDTVEWMTKRNDVLEFLHPVHLPMLVPPLPWGRDRRGGYRYALREKYPLVRGGRVAIEKEEMPLVYSALNRLQETPWKVNKDVYELAEAIMRKGGGWAGVPVLEAEPLPPKPFDIAENPEARKEWRKKAGKIKNKNHIRRCTALGYSRIMSISRKLHDEAAFFFPYSLDFRGRIYPISDFLSPQGDNLQKGLLTFAQGVPMGDGGQWLAIHLANCVGETPEGLKVSKMTFTERLAWVEQNAWLLIRTAEDPFSNPWWSDADKPFQLYAACCEFKRWYESGFSSEYVCSLPVGMDGSCNGLQHFAALLRDEEGGRAVNVVPQERPQDVYDEVARAVMDYLEAMAAENETARQWLASGQVTRKLCKRPTMTFGYGSKRFGFRAQIIEYLMALDEWPLIQQQFSDVSEAASLMAELIWAALELQVSGAFHGMAWLQASARVIAKRGAIVCWRVPHTQFPVYQDYFKERLRQVDTMIAGRIIKPTIFENTAEVEANRQANGISPNVIHSLDAAALMLTVGQAADEGVEAFGMVHDSYATVPGMASVLARSTRQCFVQLYGSVNVLAHLFETFRQQAENVNDIPCPPPVGSLDLGGVLASDYFFC